MPDPLLRNAQLSLELEREEPKGPGPRKVDPRSRSAAQSKQRAIARFRGLLAQYVRDPDARIPGDEDLLSQRAFAEKMATDERALRLAKSSGQSLPAWLESLRATMPEAALFYVGGILGDIARAHPALTARTLEEVVALLPDDVLAQLIGRLESAFYLRKTGTGGG